MQAVPQSDAERYFRRYRGAIADWSGFVASLATPLPPTLWAHPERCSASGVAALFGEIGVAAEPIPWMPGGLRLSPGAPVGGHWGFLAGLYQVQEEIAMLPARLLAARPGERVLDLCAAPGNKTAQLALAMGNTGTLYANDVQRGRLGALRQTVKRLGLRNVVTTTHPGEEFPLGCGPFDRVLVDAPCSGEGTWRKGGAAPRLPDAGADRDSLVRRQLRLLERALALTRVGGRVVYATCTLSPDENEGVIDETLRSHGSAIGVVPVREGLAGLRPSPAVAEWQGGRPFHPAVADCLRFWPHDNDTGGFFVAVLEKRDGGEPRREPGGGPEWADRVRLDRLLARFGADGAALEGAGLLAARGRYANVAPPDLTTGRRPAPHAVGLPAVAVQTRPDKPTTALALVLTGRASANVVALDGPSVDRFLQREETRVDPAGQAVPITPGFVMVAYRGFHVGVGLLRPGGRLESLYPARWARVAGRRGLGADPASP